MLPAYYSPANLPNVPLTSRRLHALEYSQSVIVTALSFFRTLSVDEVCELADLYVSLNIPPEFQKWARRHKNMPIVNRAFYACCNLAQWGSVAAPSEGGARHA
jgi:hypothetical protein